MKATLNILKRNILNYLYSPGSIFFSFLSVCILIVVYGLFLSQLQVQRIESSVGQTGGISWLVNSWLVAGLLSVSSFTVPLNILSNMVVDLEKNIFDDFYVAPIKRSTIVFGYALSAFLIGTIMTFSTFILGELFIVAYGGHWLSILDHVIIFGWISLSSLVFSGISFFIVSFIKSSSSVGALNTVVGSIIGFFAGIYVPLSSFSDSFSNIIKFNPAAHLAVAFRSIMTADALDLVFYGTPSEYRSLYEYNYGVVLSWFGYDISLFQILVYISCLAFLFYILSILRIKRFKKQI